MSMRRLATHLGTGRRLLLVGVGCMVVDAVCQLLVPAVFRVVLNAVQRDADAFVDGGWRAPAIVAVAVMVVFFNAAYFGHTLPQRAGARWAANLRVVLFEHIQRLSVDFMARARTGELAARLNQDVERVEQTLRLGANLIWTVTILVLAVVMMLVIDPILGGLAAVMLVIAAVATRCAVPRLRRLNREVREEIGATAGTMAELLGAQPLIKAFAGEGSTTAAVAGDAGLVRERTEGLVRQQFQFTDLLQVHLVFLAPFLLLFVGAWQISSDNALVGDVAAVWVFWLRSASAVSGLSNLVPDVLVGAAAADRVVEILDEEPAIADPASPRELEVRGGAIELDCVTFRYSARDAVVLDNVDLTVAPGERLAIVGPSGCGKSTLLQLVLRFYDPTDGAVRMDGQNLRSVGQQSLRRAVGVVFQESVLLSSSLAANLRLARPDATDDQLWAALEAANATEFVSRWPDRLGTRLGERGVLLSGGQRQRLAIARVFLKDPAVVLLDEPTSALDAESERAVVAALDELLRGRTSLVAAHRIATVRHADRIVVLERGRIGAAGTHDELLDASPLYRRYCRQQLVV